MNSHIKRSSLTVNWGIGSKNNDNLQSQIREFADKKTANNEVHPYMQFYSKRKNLESFFKIYDTHGRAYGGNQNRFRFVHYFRHRLIIITFEANSIF
jgi:hypothetical protein